MTEIVYILINQSMPDYVKIGKTSTTVEERMRSLSSHSGVPLPFEFLCGKGRGCKIY